MIHQLHVSLYIGLYFEAMYPCLTAFFSQMRKLFKSKMRRRNNLLPFQQRALDFLQGQSQLLVVPCDKNLGPAIIERNRYITMIMRDHLNDATTYHRLQPLQVGMYKDMLKTQLAEWTTQWKDDLSRSTKRCLRHHLTTNTKGFGNLYGTIKAHKNLPPDGLPKSRPIVNTLGSLSYAHACLLDNFLQPIAQSRPSYLKNSYELKQQLQQLQLPPTRVRLFTADAQSMYTNIPINRAIKKLSRYMDRNRERFPEIPMDAAIDLLQIILKNNFFTFGDLTFKQKKGIAMGIPPAVAVANLYMSCHEGRAVRSFTDNGRLAFYKRFIDDIFGIWIVHPDPQHETYLWNRFKERINLESGLTWDFSELSQQVVFLDMIVSLKEDRITTTLYEKELNLHLYIPPFSAHPPGLLPGIVYGSLFRIYTLCSDHNDQLSRTREFYSRLIHRGYKSSQILPLFHKAIDRARSYTGPTRGNFNQKLAILHLKFHPDDPPSRVIQRHWDRFVANPPGETPLRQVEGGPVGLPSGITRMVIAYQRPMNLGNYLSHRDLNNTQGPAASTFHNV